MFYLWERAENMKAKIEFAKNGDELRITRYYEKVGQSLSVPMDDLSEIIRVLIRFETER